jgi:hypothetical protein
MKVSVNCLKIRNFAVPALSLLLLFAAFVPGAFAVPKYYELDNGSVSAASSDPGLIINTMVKPTVPGTGFTLNDGGSFTFNFFDIWTDETTINKDDLVPCAISATINFVDPLTGATINGITVGGSWFKGLSQWGEVTWNGPVTVSLPGDRVFNITLSNEDFNFGFGGLNEGMMCGATVEATINQISSVDIPQPNDSSSSKPATAPNVPFGITRSPVLFLCCPP